MGHTAILERRSAGDANIAARLEKTKLACMRISEIITHMAKITRLELSEQSPGLPPLLDLRRSSEEP